MKALRRALVALLLAGLAVLLAGRLGGAVPLLDIANLALLPAGLATVLAGLALMWIARRWWKKALYALAGVAGAVMAWPPAAAPAQCSGDGPRLRVAWLNAQMSNDPGPIAAWLEREQPDVVALGEVPLTSAAVRQAVRAHYPHAQSCLRGDACSTLLFARAAPMASTGLARGDPANRRALSAVRMVLPLTEGGRLTVMAVHLSRPPQIARQQAELAELATHLQRPADTIMLGDFNATARMRVLADFARRHGFAIARADGPTWPLHLGGRATPPLIQIDHLLVGRNWAVERLRVSGDLGSDHRGLVGDICRRG